MKPIEIRKYENGKLVEVRFKHPPAKPHTRRGITALAAHNGHVSNHPTLNQWEDIR